MSTRPLQPATIEVERLTVHYGATCALRELHLRIEAGAVTALVGPSGCGKSTLLQSINRLTDLIPHCRVQGSVRLEGRDVHAPGTDLLALRRRVGMIFQKPNPFPLSIRRNLTLPLREHGLADRASIDAKVEQALRDVGLWDEVRDRLDGSALELSGGQQQRLCIARALALTPEVILLDEPCSALDPIAAGVVEDRLKALAGRYTVVIVTHNLGQARRLADFTGLLWTDEAGGRLVELSPTEQLFTQPRHRLTWEYVSGARG